MSSQLHKNLNGYSISHKKLNGFVQCLKQGRRGNNVSTSPHLHLPWGYEQSELLYKPPVRKTKAFWKGIHHWRLIDHNWITSTDWILGFDVQEGLFVVGSGHSGAHVDRWEWMLKHHKTETESSQQHNNWITTSKLNIGPTVRLLRQPPPFVLYLSD